MPFCNNAWRVVYFFVPTATLFGHRQRSQLPRRCLQRRRVTEGCRSGQRRWQLEHQPGTVVRRVPILPAVQSPAAVPPHVYMRIVLRQAGDVPDVPQSDQELLLRAQRRLFGRLRVGPRENGSVCQTTSVFPVDSK